MSKREQLAKDIIEIILKEYPDTIMATIEDSLNDVMFILRLEALRRRGTIKIEGEWWKKLLGSIEGMGNG